jgi:hypothetical protein
VLIWIDDVSSFPSLQRGDVSRQHQPTLEKGKAKYSNVFAIALKMATDVLTAGFPFETADSG